MLMFLNIFEHNKLINETGKILHNTNFFYMINFYILYVQNNLFEEQEDDSEEDIFRKTQALSYQKSRKNKNKNACGLMAENRHTHPRK